MNRKKRARHARIMGEWEMGERMEAEKSIKSCFWSDLVRISKLATCIRFVFCGRFSLSLNRIVLNMCMCISWLWFGIMWIVLAPFLYALHHTWVSRPGPAHISPHVCIVPSISFSIQYMQSPRAQPECVLLCTRLQTLSLDRINCISSHLSFRFCKFVFGFEVLS